MKVLGSHVRAASLGSTCERSPKRSRNLACFSLRRAEKQCLIERIPFHNWCISQLGFLGVPSGGSLPSSAWTARWCQIDICVPCSSELKHPTTVKPVVSGMKSRNGIRDSKPSGLRLSFQTKKWLKVKQTKTQRTTFLSDCRKYIH